MRKLFSYFSCICIAAGASKECHLSGVYILDCLLKQASKEDSLPPANIGGVLLNNYRPL